MQHGLVKTPGEARSLPHLDAGHEHGLDGGGHAGLQLVLDRRDARQQQVPLHLLRGSRQLRTSSVGP